MTQDNFISHQFVFYFIINSSHQNSTHMKKLLHLSVAVIISLSIHGQKNKSKDSNIPAFGKVEKADLEMKECDFDKNAEAMVLFDKGESDIIIGKWYRS